MAIDVTAELTIDAPRGHVAEYAMNSENDRVWIGVISQAQMLTEPPFGTGTQVERLASFMGRRFEYVLLEVIGYDSESLLAMKSVKGPFSMNVT